MVARNLALAFVFLWFFAGGIAHFLLTDSLLRIVPPYVPYPLAAVYISGACELLGALAILIPRTRTTGGIALIALVVCVTPANVYMWRHPELFPRITEALLASRLVFQVILIGLIWWATQSVVKRR